MYHTPLGKKQHIHANLQADHLRNKETFFLGDRIEKHVEKVS